ncbi:unnamed protein product [Oncorhynchus mykiss]|uniref:Uncharacterized protein n=1 Tax=Oncorhynchus mykiss TaxID=8022 RepID=A0A060Z8A9_ONCMY|nr:unnamed protein product [Oncorhynchus mykiss]
MKPIRMSMTKFDDPTESSDKFFSNWSETGESGWRKESRKPEPDFYLSTKSSSQDDRTAARRKADPVPVSDSGDARKKFGDVKAISSDMYFGKQDDSEVGTLSWDTHIQYQSKVWTHLLIQRFFLIFPIFYIVE